MIVDVPGQHKARLNDMERTSTSMTGWWFGTFFIFPYIGTVIIPTDSYFSEG
jgi:hypothetical protein